MIGNGKRDPLQAACGRETISCRRCLHACEAHNHRKKWKGDPFDRFFHRRFVNRLYQRFFKFSKSLRSLRALRLVFYRLIR